MKKLVAYGIAKKGQPFKITTLSDKEKLNAIKALLPENLSTVFIDIDYVKLVQQIKGILDEQI